MNISTPDWVKDAIFYQIFPDRFAKSTRILKPKLFPWDAPPPDKGYQGGDLLGIVEKLDYLQGLGINAIYLNPIFQSACNHRYHTHDYYQVDPMLGGNEALRELVQAAHKRHIRVVLDGVFNHASRGFFQFSDVLEQGSDSAYVDWFIVHDWPLHPYDESKPANYEAWVGIRDLPKINTDYPAAREFLMQVGEYWVREFHIDGWRLDVAAEITTPGFWQEFRQRIKAINPDAYIVAEIWDDAPEYLQGDQFDATMNYQWTAATIAFTAGDRVSYELVKDRGYTPWPGIDAPEYGRRLQHLFTLYDWEVTRAQMNLLDSHDTARLLSIARNDKATVRLATLLQMTFPGAPSIYYGDEIGIRGSQDVEAPFRDRDARWTFPWEEPEQWDHAMLTYFKAAIALRHGHPVLRHGRFHQLHAAGEQFAFARSLGSTTLVTAVNAATTPAEMTLSLSEYWEDGTSVQPIFGTGVNTAVTEGKAQLALPPRSGVVLAAR